MREILFRGKRLDNGEWVEGYLYKRIVHLSGFHQNVVVDAIEVYDGENPLGISYYTISPDTVGQYIGLTDKNGQKIFEGDIIKVVWQADGRTPVDDCYVAEFRNGYFAARKHNGKNVVGSIANFTNHKAIGNTGVFVEIIGNIHDNPDLLEGE